MALSQLFSQARSQRAQSFQTKSEPLSEPLSDSERERLEREEFKRRVELNRNGQTDDIVSGR